MNEIKIPYGIADFKKLREQNYIYIDKTRIHKNFRKYPDGNICPSKKIWEKLIF